MERHQIPSGSSIGGDIFPPPLKNNNLRVDFCGGHFDLIGEEDNFSKETILFMALVSCMTKMMMKYRGAKSINRGNIGTLCAERGVCTGLGEHMDPGGGASRGNTWDKVNYLPHPTSPSNNQQCGIWTRMPRVTQGYSELYHL
jgi:hypothetical protein